MELNRARSISKTTISFAIGHHHKYRCEWQLFHVLWATNGLVGDMQVIGDRLLGDMQRIHKLLLLIWRLSTCIFHLWEPGPIFCLMFWVSSDYTKPITGQVTGVTCPVIDKHSLSLLWASNKNRPWSSNKIREYQYSSLSNGHISNLFWIQVQQKWK